HEGKTDLCRAVADRKINIRVRIAASDYEMRGRVFSDGNVRVPPHLKPGDLDWAQSRPLGQWSIGPRPGQHYAWIGGWENWPLDLMGIWTADVVEILCGGDRETSSATVGQETAAIKALASHLKINPEVTRAEAADWCRAWGHNMSARRFQNWVWPMAREK